MRWLFAGSGRPAVVVARLRPCLHPPSVSLELEIDCCRLSRLPIADVLWTRRYNKQTSDKVPCRLALDQELALGIDLLGNGLGANQIGARDFSAGLTVFRQSV